MAFAHDVERTSLKSALTSYHIPPCAGPVRARSRRRSSHPCSARSQASHRAGRQTRQSPQVQAGHDAARGIKAWVMSETARQRCTVAMTMMSDSRRRRIVGKRRKLRNATKRAAKAAKRERNRRAKSGALAESAHGRRPGGSKPQVDLLDD